MASFYLAFFNSARSMTRSMAKAGWVGLLSVVWVVGAKGVLIDKESYHFPYSDPVQATAISSFVKSHFKERIPYLLELEDLPGRENLRYVGKKARTDLFFYRQKNHHAQQKPLVVLLPGTGASVFSGGSKWLAEKLYLEGFNVLVLPSVVNWKFILTSSRTGYPGLIENDLPDLARLLRKSLSLIHDRFGMKWPKIQIAGYSLGAFHAAFLAVRQNIPAVSIGVAIEKTLLINPPVSLVASLDRLDKLYHLGNRWSPKKRRLVIERLMGIVLEHMKNDINQPGYFLGLDKKIEVPRDQIAYAIGFGFQTVFAETIFISQLIDDLGVLKASMPPLNPSLRLKEAMKFGYQGYLEKFLFPWLRRQRGSVDKEEIFRRNSLYAIADELRENSSIYLMHNLDDIIVDSREIKFLEEVFGNRAWIFPAGGHLGNFWYEKNQEILLKILSDRSSSSTN